jgi:hypothetical protein
MVFRLAIFSHTFWRVDFKFCVLILHFVHHAISFMLVSTRNNHTPLLLFELPSKQAKHYRGAIGSIKLKIHIRVNTYINESKQKWKNQVLPVVQRGGL